MRKIIFFASLGYAGMDSFAKVEEFDPNTTDKALNALAYEYALEEAESYGIEPMENAEDDQEDEQTSCGRFNRFSDDIDGWWEEYNKEKHEGLI